MTIIEQLQKEQEYNIAHQLFAPLDDDEMGERLPGLFRAEIEDDEREYLRIIFDDGECFLYDYTEGVWQYKGKLPDDYFIHKHLEKVVYDFMVEHDLQSPIYCSRNEVSTKSIIKLLIYRDDRVVDLPNIMLPPLLRQQGQGLKLISDLYTICKRLGYRLIITMMVESFYKRMITRGAASIDFETVEINDNTFFGKR